MKNKILTSLFIFIAILTLSSVFICDTANASDMQQSEDFAYDPEISEYDDSAESTDIINEQAPFIFTELTENTDGYLITVTGNMPENAYLAVERLTYTEGIEDKISEVIAENTDEITDFSVYEVFNIDIYDENGDKWQPCDFFEQVSVKISGIDVKDERNILSGEGGLYEDISIEVYRYEDNSIDLMHLIDTSDESVEFETDHFTNYVLGSKTVTNAIAVYPCGFSYGSATNDVLLYVIENDTYASKYDYVAIGNGRMYNYEWYTDSGWSKAPPWVSNNDDVVNIIVESGITQIGRCDFADCSVKSAIIMGGVTIIDEYAFKKCEDLVSVALPATLTDIKKWAFEECKSLLAVTIPSGVTTIGDFAFSQCESLGIVNLPNSITSFGEYVFQCAAISDITIPTSITELSEGLFANCTNLDNVTIPSNITKICPSVFMGCRSLENITIPDSVTEIGFQAFYRCAFDHFVFPSNVTSIPSLCFAYCNNLVNLTIPDYIEKIEYGAFVDCKSLESVVIPDSVIEIESRAFSGCIKLTGIEIGTGLTTIGADSFKVTNQTLTKLTTQNSTAISYNWAGDNRSILKEQWNDGNISGNYSWVGTTSVTCDDNVIAYLYLNPDGSTYTLSLEGYGKVAGYVTSFYAPWRAYSQYITKLILDDRITYLCQRAFSDLAIEEVILPGDLELVGYAAFDGCNSLTVIDLNSLPGNTVEFMEDAFRYTGPGYLDTTLKNVDEKHIEFLNYDWGYDKRAVDLSSFTGGSFTYKGVTYYLADATSKTDNNDKYWFETPGILYIPVNSMDSTLPTGAKGNIKILYLDDFVTKAPKDFYSSTYGTDLSLREARLPQNGFVVKNSMFYGCKNLREVDLSDVTKIEFYAFMGCDSLKKLNFGENLTEIGDRVFMTSGGYVETEFSGCLDNPAVLNYPWTDEGRLKQLKYRIMSADNDELIIEDNFTSNLKVDNINLYGYSGDIYLDRECTEPVTFPHYSFTDTTFYIDIESAEVLSDVKVLKNPVNAAVFTYFDTSALQSVVKFRDGTDVYVEWTDYIPDFNVDLTGLKVEIKTSSLTKDTLEYSKRTDISENGETAGGYTVEAARLYNDDIEFTKYADGFNVKEDDPGRSRELALLIPNSTLNMNCDILISKDGYKRTVTVPVVLNVVKTPFSLGTQYSLSMSTAVDRRNAPVYYPSDCFFRLYIRDNDTHESTAVGIIPYGNFHLYKREGSTPYRLVADDELLDAYTGYYIFENPALDNDKDILYNGMCTVYITFTPAYSGGSVYVPPLYDYRLDIYYDLRAYGKGLKYICADTDEYGSFSLDDVDKLGIDTKKYGSVRYDMYGITIPYTMDDTFDFDEVTALGGIYSYGLKNPGDSFARAFHLFSCDEYYRDNNYYVIYIVPLFGATLESSYTVKLPASVELSKNSAGADGTFNVFTKGKIGSLNTLHVFVNNPDVNKLTGKNTSREIPFSVSKVRGSDYFYYDTITENYPAYGNEYKVSISKEDMENAPVDTYTGSINVEYRIEPRF